MEESDLNKYPTKTIRRSGHKHSIVFRWYLRLAILSTCGVLLFLSVYVMVGDIYFFIDRSWIFTLISIGFSLYYSLINKGSLVEEVTVDYAKQEVRVLHYTLFNQEHKTVVPFEGLSWSILPGGQSLDRFRIIPKEGPRIIICEGGLGWKSEDIERLSLALSKVVDMEPWYMKI